jgi:hypothetical protein
MRHHQPRQPKKTGGFSWGRSLSAGGLVMWRLFRRDQRGALHMKQITPRSEWSRAAIATELNRARHALRDQVDEIDLALMGVTE